MLLTVWFRMRVCYEGSGKGLSCPTLVLLYCFYFINCLKESKLLKCPLAATAVNMDIDPKARILCSQAAKISFDSMKIFRWSYESVSAHFLNRSQLETELDFIKIYEHFQNHLTAESHIVTFSMSEQKVRPVEVTAVEEQCDKIWIVPTQTLLCLLQGPCPLPLMSYASLLKPWSAVFILLTYWSSIKCQYSPPLIIGSNDYPVVTRDNYVLSANNLKIILNEG